jgi:hypothetical protein
MDEPTYMAIGYSFVILFNVLLILHAFFQITYQIILYKRDRKCSNNQFYRFLLRK